MTTPVIIVHGGAWSIPDDIVGESRAGTKAAARAGYAVLSSGGTAIDAIQAAVRVLEDDPCFDAGTGSVLTANGDVEMDAVIMDGRTLESGAVACVHNIKNPIELARNVMEKTDHCLLVGPGANLFAEEVGIKRVPTETLVSAKAVRELQFYHANYDCTVHDLFRQSPIIGAGGYADNDVGGISCTGHGESISKVVLAHQVIAAMRTGTDAQEAADKALANMASRVDGYGGVIVLGREGDVALSFTTERMSWAWAKEGTIHSGVNPGEDFREPVDVTNGDVANGDVQNGGASNSDV
ncbi:ASGL1-like protein [Mya arenaria]|uniref:ASGL1-like protein n=1 Tax=Mya arenaria TaxID=6604 RepID=A0ABY7FBZ4_MYAAR|nr:ASGL1-like protein [Mya arenaria]